MTPATSASIASGLVRSIAHTHQLDGNSEAALDTLEAALAIAELAGDESALGNAINVQAVICWRQGDLDQAERLYMRACECGMRSGDARLTAMTAQNRGAIANVRGDLPVALRHYETSLAAYRALALPHEIVGTLNNLGMLHTDLGHWVAAERSYEEATSIASAAEDRSALVLLEVNLAELWIAQGQFGRARASCDRALALALECADPHAQGESHKHLGVIARETGHYRLAEDHFVRAEALAGERQDILLLAEVSRERAELNARQGRHREAVQDLNRAHNLFSQLHARRDLPDIDRRTSRLESSFIDVVRRWGESIESKDVYTQGHCVRVADIACAIARRTGMEERRLFWFRVGALLHDVGKISVPEAVLNKPGRLTTEEWTLMRSHPEEGVRMLAGIDFPEDVLPIILSHHEKWNGTGYPHGISGEDIPASARMLGIADVYDALTTDRSYKKGFSHDEAMTIMRGEVGLHFDPALFDHFELVMRERRTGIAA